MKKQWKKICEMIYGREYELRERIFRMIILIGCTLLILGIIECIGLMDVKLIVIPLVVLLIVLGVELLVTFKYRKIDVGAVIVGFLIILFVFPTMVCARSFLCFFDVFRQKACFFPHLIACRGCFYLCIRLLLSAEYNAYGLQSGGLYGFDLRRSCGRTCRRRYFESTDEDV